MLRATNLISLVSLAAVTLGCTTSHGNTYRSPEWHAGQPLGKVMMIVAREAPANLAHAEKDRQMDDAIRNALAQVPGTTVIRADSVAPVPGGQIAEQTLPVSEASALAAARAAGAQTVCLVTLGATGGRFLVMALPPGWDLRTSVQYAVRLLDVQTGQVLVDSVRERTTGGYLAITAATSPTDLTADLASVLGSPQK